VDTFHQFASRFKRPVFLWSFAALIAEAVCQWVAKDVWPGPQARWLTLLPLVPMIGFVVALVRAILRMDELQRRICLESISIAFVLTLLVTFAFIGLERAEVYAPKWNELGTYMLFLWACAYVVTVRRYK